MFAEAMPFVNDSACLNECEACADEEADVDEAVGEGEGYCDVEETAGEDEQCP